MLKYNFFLVTTCFAYILAASPLKVFANEKGLVCSEQLGSSINRCPSSMQTVARNASRIPTIYSSCGGGLETCIDDDYPYNAHKDYFTFFDVDNNDTVKFEVSVTPNVYSANGITIQHGVKSVREITASPDEKEVTELFNDTLINKSNLDKALTLRRSQSGTVRDATGQVSNVIAASQDACLTALDYVTNNIRGCRGKLNRDILEGVDTNATFAALISSLEQLESVINVFIPDLDLSNIGELNEFKLVMKMHDGSKLVLDIKIDKGVAQITLDELGSLTSDGSTFKQARELGTGESGSLGEAYNIAEGFFVAIHCTPARVLSSSEYHVAARVTKRDEDGNEVVVIVYQRQDTFVTFNKC